MKRIPTFYNSELEQIELTLITCSDKLGNIHHYVEYFNNDGSKDYASFKNLSSALDFIHSNFK